jgi:hypothetical protein
MKKGNAGRAFGRPRDASPDQLLSASGSLSWDGSMVAAFISIIAGAPEA